MKENTKVEATRLERETSQLYRQLYDWDAEYPSSRDDQEKPLPSLATVKQWRGQMLLVPIRSEDRSMIVHPTTREVRDWLSGVPKTFNHDAFVEFTVRIKMQLGQWAEYAASAKQRGEDIAETLSVALNATQWR